MYICMYIHIYRERDINIHIVCVYIYIYIYQLYSREQAASSRFGKLVQRNANSEVVRVGGARG